jgi:8-oxo-dGTP pyrophosphatase MutT (NUDIX family)
MNTDFATELRERLQRVIDRPRRVVERPDLKRAAVLVPIIVRNGNPQIVLTVRTMTVASHKGQVSFPGGHAEPDDSSPQQTALREAWEEIGLEPHLVEVLGLLDDMATSTSFLITPVLGLVDPKATFAKDPREVAEIFEAPLSAFQDPAHHELVCLEYANACHRFHKYTLGPHIVWGATAEIIHDFLQELVALE